MVGCAVVGCKKRSAKENMREHGISYHIFPRDPSVREKWRKFCGRPEPWCPLRTSVICSTHFELECFEACPNNRRILNLAAIPTLKVSHIVDTSNFSLQENRQNQANTSLTSNTSAAFPLVPQDFIDEKQDPSTDDSKPDTSNDIIKPDFQFESLRNSRLREKLQLKHKKIRRLQSKTRYLQKKIDSLQDLLRKMEAKYRRIMSVKTNAPQSQKSKNK